MSQSSVIVGALVAGFFIYVTIQGHLGNYLALLGI